MAKAKKPFPCPEFGQHLRKLRLEAGLTQEDFAGDNFDRTYISGVERGERNVSLVNIFRFSEVLKIHPAQLFDFYAGHQSRRPSTENK